MSKADEVDSQRLYERDPETMKVVKRKVVPKPIEGTKAGNAKRKAEDVIKEALEKTKKATVDVFGSVTLP